MPAATPLPADEQPTKLAVSTDEAAASVGLKPKTFRNWRSLGYGPKPTRMSPSMVVYRIEDLEAWLKAVQKAGSYKAVPLAEGGAK